MDPRALGREQRYLTHSANSGVKLQERCGAVGIGSELVYRGASGVTHKNRTA